MMNSVHDLGGMQNFGPVDIENSEQVFHARWEGRVLGLQRAILSLGVWNIDVFRYQQECVRPSDYLSWSYYERWARTLAITAIEKGLISEDELSSEEVEPGNSEYLSRRLTQHTVGRAFVRGNFECQGTASPKFEIGDRVQTKDLNPIGHTRIPRYARGRNGVIVAIRGRHVFPDDMVALGVENGHWLYTVEFSGVELWGDKSEPSLIVSIDAFEPYLIAD